MFDKNFWLKIGSTNLLSPFRRNFYIGATPEMPDFRSKNYQKREENNTKGPQNYQMAKKIMPIGCKYSKRTQKILKFSIPMP
jgi:hypothetical protein